MSPAQQTDYAEPVETGNFEIKINSDCSEILKL